MTQEQSIQDSGNDDVYEQALRDRSVSLQECQKAHSLSSCMPCAEFLECPKRKEYVKAVYESLSKGQEGAFDFN